MLRCYFYLPLLTLALYASMVQTAPSQEALMAIYRVDQVGFPANEILSRDYALAEKRVLVRKELPLLEDFFEQNDGNEMQMHFLQLNLMKILIILDVIILICIFYSINRE